MEVLEVALCQFSPFWEDKERNLAWVAAMWERYTPKAQVLILPEMFTTGFTMNAAAMAEPLSSSETLEKVLQWAKQWQVLIIGSWITTENNCFYNTLHAVTPEGNIYRYHKRKLFRMSKEPQVYTPGNQFCVFEWRGWRFMVQVCYDLRFASVTANRVENGQFFYDIGVNVASWPAMRAQQWRSLLIARAIENQAYFIGVNRCGRDGNGLYYQGNSMAVDMQGNPLIEITHGEAIVVVQLSKQALQQFREKFPVWKDW